MFSTSDSSLQPINTISVCQALKFILLSSLKRYPYFLLLWEIGWMSTLNPVPTYKVILDIYLLFFYSIFSQNKSFLLKKCLQFVKRKSWESLEHFLNTYLLQLSHVFTSLEVSQHFPVLRSWLPLSLPLHCFLSAQPPHNEMRCLLSGFS